MKRDKLAIIAVSTAAAIIAVCGVLSLLRPEIEPEIIEYKPNLRAMLELDHADGKTSTLVVGYNYYLLEEFAKATGRTINIQSSKRKTKYLDSLKTGHYDILVLPYNEEFDRDSVLVSEIVDSTSVWLMQENDRHELELLNEWIEQYNGSEGRESQRELFLRRFNPYRSRPRENLSPYDSLIRLYADSLAWDWRQLAAIVYKESRFHIEARSYRGARGLMQMMPHTARHYGLQDPLNPEESIAAGYRLLNDLDKRYIKYAPEEQERFKLVLAAYNAGVGRMADIMNLAKSMDIATHSWDSLKTVIPYMNDKESLDTGIVKLGVFKGTETLNYVEDVSEIYREFCRICY